MEDRSLSAGEICFVPTPIGNLEDMTLRGLRKLREADLIACEDTRHTRILLRHYSIDRPLCSYHQHNEQSRSEELLRRAEAGERICVVSDAGMPGISDPGAVLIRHCQERGIPYTVLPGASAVTTAVVLSGLGEGPFAFLGFLERKGTGRTRVLEWMDHAPLTSVLYEAPHRIRATVRELASRWPTRTFVTVRELSKQYESWTRFLGQAFCEDQLPEKGEYVLLVGPAVVAPTDEMAVRARLAQLRASGSSSKEAISQVVEETGWSKNAVYRLQISMKMENET